MYYYGQALNSFGKAAETTENEAASSITEQFVGTGRSLEMPAAYDLLEWNSRKIGRTTVSCVGLEPTTW